MTPETRRRPLPVPWLAAMAGLVLLWATLPGVAWGQDLLTRPDPEAVPVLLVPGWGDDAADVEPLRQRFLEAGWPLSRVRTVGFEDPVGSNRMNAREIARAAEVLQGMTGAERVDVVAHSMGGLAVRHFLAHEGGADVVRRVVFLGTPHRGTVVAMLAWGDGGREMVPGSSFLTALNDTAQRPEGVEMLAIRTPVDLRVIPGSSAVLPGALNLEVCCPAHPELVEDEEVFRKAAAFLREGAEGVPEAEVSEARPDWGGTSFELWRPWTEFWAEGPVRRWLLPSAGDSGTSGGGGGDPR